MSALRPRCVGDRCDGAGRTRLRQGKPGRFRRAGRPAFYFSVLLLVSVHGFGFTSDPTTVDQSAALCVGDTEISHYIVDKNFNLFVAGVRQSHHRSPTSAEITRWFRVFIAQMTLKAQLARSGWLERPDISRNVAVMSRYILTGVHGPLYETLYDHRPIPPDRVQSALAISQRSFDASIVRFDDEETARRELDACGGIAAFSALGSSARIGAPNTDVHDGPIHWPFHPFEEIAAELSCATPGQALGPLRRSLGIYYVILHAVSPSESYGPTSPAGMAEALQILDDDVARRRHRAAILRREQFSPRLPLVETAIDRLLPASASGGSIAPEAWSPLATATLASYRLDGVTRRITGRDFAEYFNRRVVRHVPRSSAELVAALQDMAVEESDVLTARRLNLDRTPRFVEDRRNFALNQILATYEQEILAPHLQPAADELQAYAAAHREEYLAPVASAGTLYIFAGRAEAERAVIRLQRTGGPSAVANVLETVDPFFVRREDAQLVPHLPNAAIVAAADGALFGPFLHEGRPAVFLKRASGAPVALPFAAIESRVRGDFVRARLDEAELALFRQNAAVTPLRIHLVPAKYGLPASFVFDAGPMPAAPPDFRSDRTNTRPGKRSAGPEQKTTTHKNPVL